VLQLCWDGHVQLGEAEPVLLGVAGKEAFRDVCSFRLLCIVWGVSDALVGGSGNRTERMQEQSWYFFIYLLAAPVDMMRTAPDRKSFNFHIEAANLGSAVVAVAHTFRLAHVEVPALAVSASSPRGTHSNPRKLSIEPIASGDNNLRRNRRSS
jgi:hypothetical protein